MNQKAQIKQKEKEKTSIDHLNFKEKIIVENQILNASQKAQELENKVKLAKYDEELKEQTKIQAITKAKPKYEADAGLDLESYKKKPLKF